MAKTSGVPQLLRALAAQAAEALALPATASFVSLAAGALPDPYSDPRLVEFSFDSLVLGGTVAADAVTFSFWRQLSGPPTGTPATCRDLIGQVTIPAANVGYPPPALLEVFGTQVWVTVQFINGTAPVVTGNVLARGVG